VRWMYFHRLPGADSFLEPVILFHCRNLLHRQGIFSPTGTVLDDLSGRQPTAVSRDNEQEHPHRNRVFPYCVFLVFIFDRTKRCYEQHCIRHRSMWKPDSSVLSKPGNRRSVKGQQYLQGEGDCLSSGITSQRHHERSGKHHLFPANGTMTAPGTQKKGRLSLGKGVRIQSYLFLLTSPRSR